MARNPSAIRVPDVDDADNPAWVGHLRQAITVLADNQIRMVETIDSVRTRLDASDARLLAVKESVTKFGTTLSRVEDALTSRSEGGGLRGVMEELQGLNQSLGDLAASNRDLNSAVNALAGKVDGAALNAAVDAAAMLAGGGTPFSQPAQPGPGPLLPGAATARRTGDPNAMPRVHRYGDEE